MGEKSVRKKQFILKKAREVFAERGYKDVTMKDIVDACQISRGGLYLYFDSTKEIFLEVLNTKDDGEENVFAKALDENATSADLLALFLQEQKRELCNQDGSLTVAMYEFFFANKMDKSENMMHAQFDNAVRVIEKLIADGVKSGELVCDDPKGAARNMMYVLEGLRVMSQTVGITEKAVNKEILYLMKGIINEA